MLNLANLGSTICRGIAELFTPARVVIGVVLISGVFMIWKAVAELLITIG